MQIIATVITYNRLALLKECIDALRKQDHPLFKILVINNSSTDGTLEWLQSQPDILFFTFPNTGGAAGFSNGIKKSIENGADWVWLMDDDSIPQPEALRRLVDAIHFSEQQGDHFGYFGSKVLWTNGTPHPLNIQGKVMSFTPQKIPLQQYLDKNIIPIKYSSFVSLLLSKEMIEKNGLPYSEFFIWNDDVEYTQRIGRNNMGALVDDSIVIHKTAVNYNTDIFADSVNNLWKHKYGLRNSLFVRKKYKSHGSYVRHIFKRIFAMPISILLKRKDHRWLFIKTVWQSSFRAIFFNPKIEYLDKKK